AEHDVLRVRLGGELRELERIAGQLGMLVYVGALVVVSQYDGAPAELRARGEYALVARVVSERLELVERYHGRFHGLLHEFIRIRMRRHPLSGTAILSLV